MKKFLPFIIGTLIIVIAAGTALSEGDAEKDKIALKDPDLKGKMTFEQAVKNRRSQRSLEEKALSVEQIGQLCWAAQGVTMKKPPYFRSAPSAGARYPINLYVFTSDGIHTYVPRTHELKRVSEKDGRTDLGLCVYNHDLVGKAPAVFVFSIVPARTTSKYGAQRGARYAIMDVGFSAENLLLQAVALGLGSVPVGAFKDDDVKKIIGMEEKEYPMLITPVGYIKKKDAEPKKPEEKKPEKKDPVFR